MSARRTVSWRDADGSGHLHTLTLPDVPAAQFTASMVGANIWMNATPTRQSFTAGQMPRPALWPSTLAAEPDLMLRQLETIRPGIDSPAQLLRAIAAAHTSYLITRETRAAELHLLATTVGISVRQADIPTYTVIGPMAPGLLIAADDLYGSITLHLHADTGYLAAAVEHSDVAAAEAAASTATSCSPAPSSTSPRDGEPAAAANHPTHRQYRAVPRLPAAGDLGRGVRLDAFGHRARPARPPAACAGRGLATALNPCQYNRSRHPAEGVGC